MGDGDLAETVRVDTVFERFPASVRGAVVLRGRDGDPHHVALTEAAVVELGKASPARVLELGDVIVNVAPRKDVMIPFEVMFAGLEPGWYRVEAEVVVDGQERVRGPLEEPRRFVVGWPSGAIRKGSVDCGLTIAVPGSAGVTVERVVCKGDAAVVHWRHRPGDGADDREFGELKVRAGRSRLTPIEDGFEFGTGRRTTTVYPVPKGESELAFELDRRFDGGKLADRGPWSATLALD